MARLRFRIAISLEEYTAGPKQSVENSLGAQAEGGTRGEALPVAHNVTAAAKTESRELLIIARAKIRQAPVNYSWAYEMQIEDPDGHVLRFGSEPK